MACAYALIQFQPDALRAEGVNVAVVAVRSPAVVAVRSPGEVVVRTLEWVPLAEAIVRVGVPLSQHAVVALGLAMFAKRLGQLQDCTAEGLAAFASTECGRFVVLPARDTADNDPDAIAKFVMGLCVERRPPP